MGPPIVVTSIATDPLSPGVVAVIWVGESTVNAVAGVVPKSTAVAVSKWVPVMVTLVPPVAGPDAGVKLVMVGAGT